MKNLKILVAAVLAPLVLAARPADQLAYSPKAGSVLTREFTMDSEVALEEMSMEMDGNDVSQMAGNIEFALKVAHRLGVTDTYEAVSDGRPSRLRRSFDEITTTSHFSSSNPMGKEEKDNDLESPLEGSSVLFAIEDDGGYEPSFAGDAKGDAELLEGLIASMDFVEVLPGHEVAVDDSWDLPLDLMRQILQPAGNLSEKAEGAESSQFDVGIKDLIDEMEGDFKAIYAGTREEDGTRVAVIRLELEARSAKDLSSKSEEMVSSMQENMPPGLEVEVSAFDVEFSYDAEGELYWNIEEGRLHSMHLSGSVSQVLDINMNIGNDQERHSMIQSLTMGGTMALSMSVDE